ncbi:unnamed protein product, partial [Polarella glacialis]
VHQHVDGPRGGLNVVLEFSMPPFYPLHEASLALRDANGEEGKGGLPRDAAAIQSIQATLRGEIMHSLEGSEVVIKVLEWLTLHGEAELARCDREFASSSLPYKAKRGQAAEPAAPAEPTKEERIDQARRDRLSDKYTETWDLCSAFVTHGHCKNKNCKWRHEKPEKPAPKAEPEPKDEPGPASKQAENCRTPWDGRLKARSRSSPPSSADAAKDKDSCLAQYMNFLEERARQLSFENRGSDQQMMVEQLASLSRYASSSSVCQRIIHGRSDKYSSRARSSTVQSTGSTKSDGSWEAQQRSGNMSSLGMPSKYKDQNALSYDSASSALDELSSNMTPATQTQLPVTCNSIPGLPLEDSFVETVGCSPRSCAQDMALRSKTAPSTSRVDEFRGKGYPELPWDRTSTDPQQRASTEPGQRERASTEPLQQWADMTEGGEESVNLNFFLPRSAGSVGHPELCKRPCLFFLAQKCTGGSACGYCHFPHDQLRPVQLDRNNRTLLRSMPAAVRLAVLLPLIQERAAETGLMAEIAKDVAMLEQRAECELSASARQVAQKQFSRLRIILRKQSLSMLLNLAHQSVQDGLTDPTDEQMEV